MKNIPTGALCYTRRPKLFDLTKANREWYKKGGDKTRFENQLKSYNYPLLDDFIETKRTSSNQYHIKKKGKKNEELKTDLVNISVSHFESSNSFYYFQINPVEYCSEGKTQIQRIVKLLDKENYIR